MKILIDLQGCQTASRYRGIGRYSVALVSAIIRNKGSNEVLLLANGALPNGLADLRAQFSPEIQDKHFIVFDFDGNVAAQADENIVRARLAELQRERLIDSIAPDVVLLTSLFEGYGDHAVTSVGSIGRTPLTAVTLYDLIPYINPDPNWPANYKGYYDRKIASLKRADLLLSISRFSGEEAGQVIPELAKNIVNISSACDALFFPGTISSARKKYLFSHYGITAQFVMSSGIVEPRKNHELLVRAFANLTAEVKSNRQIVLVGGGEQWLTEQLKLLAVDLGLNVGQLIFTGHVPEDDLRDLYRLCELFVFPSKHEGFGLPPLEAMSCGAVVLGAKATSVPEVIGLADSLFDPNSVVELCGLMERALIDGAFRDKLKSHGMTRAREFSWDRSAKTALKAISRALAMREPAMPVVSFGIVGRPKLAMISPLPPEQTGIADYVADLLPELSKYYEITVISDQVEVLPGPNGEAFSVKPISWFELHAENFERIVYQVGNSPFHAHMMDLLERYPGVVVLHDFYISSLKSWKEQTGYHNYGFRDALINSHGYVAIAHLQSEGMQAAKFRWPCSFAVVNSAMGVVVHSEYSRNLVSQHYGSTFSNKVNLVRQHRAPVVHVSRNEARQRLGIPDDAFLVCAFGFMDSTKLNHVLLDAWSRSSLAGDGQCWLVFVGGRAESDYASRLDSVITGINNGARIAITGFAPREVFDDYMASADAAVQLRTQSRGETSRTVLDCLAYGVPVVINAHGPMDEYPDDVLIKLADRFDVSDLVAAMERLRVDDDLRQSLAAVGVNYIRDAHAPSLTAKGYVEMIERVASCPVGQKAADAIRCFWRSMPAMPLEKRRQIAAKVTEFCLVPRRPVIYLDLSATVRSDLKTGIERVARALLQEMLLAQPDGYLVAPVYLVEEGGRWRVRHASTWLARQDGFSLVPHEDELVTPAQGDWLMGLDLSPDGVVSAAQAGLYAYWRAAGASVGFMVYDLLPITHPEFFPPWAPAGHQAWTEAVVSNSNQIVCISRHVQSELNRWMAEQSIPKRKRPRLAVSYLGANVAASFPTTGIPDDASHVLEILISRPTFLMVGTVEPRKGHLQMLRTFAELWASGIDVNLVIAGHEGWKGLPQQERRNIPETMQTIRSSPELGLRLFWLDGISDEYLERIYDASDCLIAASYDEGYGLPIIEAFHHNISVLARDIPVFREVGGRNTWYFRHADVEELGKVIAEIERKKLRRVHGRKAKWISWNQSALNLGRILSR